MWFQHVKGVLDVHDCNALIEKAETFGFERAKVQHYNEQKQMDNVRNNSRVEFDDVALTQVLQDKLMAYMGNDFPYVLESENAKYNKMGSHMRFYKYQPKEYFKPHKDGGYHDKELKSFITILTYLNDTDGGQTVLMPEGPGKVDKFIHIFPKAGDVLMFEHKIWHEGKPVNSGEKYVLRTDAFYNVG